ncbi:NAD(P)-dependent oxidoreductase [Pelagibacteraceae bacterium]|nr:NAD(P)-dependent oxidoreductase [Pelagibacteraceae bacterium]
MLKKKILIIGGTGFIGYHLAKACIKKRWSVTSISLKKPLKNRYIKNVKYILCDISKKKLLQKKLKIKTNFNYVVNLGGHIDHTNKTKTYASHYIGLKNLISFFKKKKINLFIQVGSSSEYGKASSPQKESMNGKPIKIYGKSKLLATHLAIKSFEKYNFPCTVFRLYQIYGPGQSLNRFLPILINSCIYKKSFPCSNGKQLRDFLYINDLLNAFFKAFNNKDIKGKILNIGLGKPIQLLKIIKKVKNDLKGGNPIYGKIKLRIDEPKILFPNISLAKKYLKWKPRIKFVKGLEKTIYSFKKNN